MLSQRGGWPNLQQALQLVEANLKEGNASIEGRVLQVVLMSEHPQREERRAALEKLNSVVGGQESLTPAARYTLATMFARREEWPKVRDLLRGISEPEPMALFVRALIRSGELDEAEQWLRVLEGSDPEVVSKRAAASGAELRPTEVRRCASAAQSTARCAERDGRSGGGTRARRRKAL